MPTTVDFNPVSNQTTSQTMSGGSPDYSGLAQSFTGIDATLDSADFNLKTIIGTPDGTLNAKIYSHSGTFGTSSAPGALLATSDNFNPNVLTTSFAQYTFNFSGANRIALVNGTNYVLSIEWTGYSTSYVVVGVSTPGAVHPGNWAYFYVPFGTWGPTASADLIFDVYGIVAAQNLRQAMRQYQPLLAQ